MSEGDKARDAVFVPTGELPMENPQTVMGYDFDEGVDYDKLFDTMSRMGFQATNFGNGIKEIRKMIERKLRPSEEDRKKAEAEDSGCDTNCRIFLGYTSNMASCGVRDVIRFLCKHKMVDCIVATAGGIEEDFIKCLAPTYIGRFDYKGVDLRKRGMNRIGNLIVPNDNYCKFEDWMLPILDAMVDEQEKGTKWTPSKFIDRLGKEINDESSIYYWCWKNKIPVYSPALTDGSIGDMIYFHSYTKPGLVIDIVEDIRGINNCAKFALNTGMILLGGGVIKHHICNANLMRNGADYSLFVNTGQEFDGSDTGAKPDEAVSWGKIKMTANPVKISGDSTLIFPLLVSQTFAKYVHEFDEFNHAAVARGDKEWWKK